MFQKNPSMEKLTNNEGGFTFFRRNFFASHRRKTSWANPSVFQKCSGIKIFCVVGCHDFVNLFCLTLPKKFVGGPFCFVNVLLLKKFWIIRYHDFVGFFLSHVAGNHRGRNLLCCRNIMVSNFSG